MGHRMLGWVRLTAAWLRKHQATVTVIATTLRLAGFCYVVAEHFHLL